MQHKSYRIERLSPGNIHFLRALYQQVFKKEESVVFFRKKYSTSQFGAEFIGYIAFTDENSPVAFYGVIPCIMQIRSSEVLAAQSADTMTHEDHRNQGLFRSLALKTYKLAKENGVKFIFGFPNENSFPGFVKLGWEFTSETLKLFTIPASQIPFAKLFFKTRRLFWIYILIVQVLLDRDSVRKNIFEGNDTNGIKHNDRFMEYKTYSKSFYTRLDSADLWIKVDSSMKVGFVHFQTSITGYKFVKKIRSLASRFGCSKVSFITHKHSPLYNVLFDVVKPADSLPIGFYNLSEERFQFNQISFEYCDMDIF